MTIEFFEDTHTYLVDGVIVPSVTQVIVEIIGNAYGEVPAAILKKKADYGTKVHRWIEKYAMTGETPKQSEMMKLSTDQYKHIAFKERIIIQSVEQAIAYGHRYAGTYDMYGTWKGAPTIFDIKTTVELNTEYLEWQLGMYKLAMTQPVEKTACIWLPKGDVAQLVEIQPKSELEIIEMLNDKFPEVNLEDLPF